MIDEILQYNKTFVENQRFENYINHLEVRCEPS